jgi:hypothetical protein
LAEAARWFEMVDDGVQSGFPRSKDFAPPNIETDQAVLRHVDSPKDRRRTIDLVCDGRSRWLSGNQQPLQKSRRGAAAEGRILGYRLVWSLADGASEAVTGGFFNVYDEPPWDLWIGYVVDAADKDQEYLVSWIPPSLVQLADDGISVDPLESLLWLEDLELQLVR